MKTVAVFFGGQSVEHEVSIITALQIIENMDKEKYTAVPIYIDKLGDWYSGETLSHIDVFKNKTYKDAERVYMNSIKGDSFLYYSKTGLLKKSKPLCQIDICFPAIHGTNGEDGTLQGFFEFKNIAYVGSNVTSSALGMDKIMMKKLFKIQGLPIVNFKWFYRSDYLKNSELIIQETEKELRYPLIVKPSNLGSSVGISVVKTVEELEKAIEIACQYDRKILVEEKVENCREINCAVLGMENNIEASLCEEPFLIDEILSFEDKYVQKSKNFSGKAGEKRRIPADISEELDERVKKLAKEAFRSIDASGVSRIDFLYNDKKELLYVNEINTIPGSMSFYLWEKMNVDFKMLIDKLIEIALYANAEKQHTKFSYEEIDLFNKNYQGK